MKIETNVMMNIFATATAHAPTGKAPETIGEGGVEKNKQDYMLKYVGDRFSRVNISTEIYAENVIKEAVKKIKSGESIDESKRAIQIFASIVKADPIKIIYG